MDTTRQRKLDRLKRELYISDNSDIEEIIEEVMEEVIEKDVNGTNAQGSNDTGNSSKNTNFSSVSGSSSHHHHHHHSDHPFKRKRDVERIDYNDNKRRANYILKSPVKKKDNTGRHHHQPQQQQQQQQSLTSNPPLFTTPSHYNTRSNTSKGSSSSNSGSNSSTAKPSRRSSRQHEPTSGKTNQVKEETVPEVSKKDTLEEEIVRPDEKNVKVDEDVTEFDADDEHQDVEHQDAEHEEITGISGDTDIRKSSTEEITKSEEVQKDKHELDRVDGEDQVKGVDEGVGENQAEGEEGDDLHEEDEEVYDDEDDEGEEENEGEEEDNDDDVNEDEEDDVDEDEEDDVDEDEDDIDLLEDDISKKTQQLESESEFESFVRDAIEDDENEQLEEDESEANLTFKQTNTNFTNSIIDESWLERVVRHDLEKKISVLGDSTDTGADFSEQNDQIELGNQQTSETDTKLKSTSISASASASLSPPSESSSSVPISESVNDELKNLYQNKSLEIINERCQQIDKVVAEIDAEIAAVKKNRLSHRPALYTSLFAPLFERTAAKVAIAERLQKYKLDQAAEIARINKETTHEQFFTAFDENRKHLKHYVQSQLHDLDLAIANRVKVPAKTTARETANTAGMELLADIVAKCAFEK